jgi:hypothetical protein
VQGKAYTEQLDRYGYESVVVQTAAKPRDFKFAADKALVFLIMGSFMLEDGKVIGEEGVWSSVKARFVLRASVPHFVLLQPEKSVS